MRLRAKAKVLVEFFGPALDLAPPNTRKIFAQVHHGQKDEFVPFDPNYSVVTSTLKNEGAVTEFYSYPGAGHGFIGGDQNNVKANSDSRIRTLGFFANHL